MTRYIIFYLILSLSISVYAGERSILERAYNRLYQEETMLQQRYTPEIVEELDSASYTEKTYKDRLKRRYAGIKAARNVVKEQLKRLSSEEDNESLHQKVVFLDPGHGGSDPGAAIIDSNSQDNDGPAYFITENEMNLAIAKLVKRNLENCGMTVILSRLDEGTTLSLETRSALCRAIQPDISVSIHLNSSEYAFPIFDQPETALPEMNYTRVYVWCPSENDFLFPMYWSIHEEQQKSRAHEESIKLADMIANSLRRELGLDFVLSPELEGKLDAVKLLRTALWREKYPPVPPETKRPVPEKPEIPAEILKRNKEASEQYIESLRDYKGVSGKDLHMTRETEAIPAVLVEAVFLSCPDEQTRLLYENRKNTIADGITRGILTYFESESPDDAGN